MGFPSASTWLPVRTALRSPFASHPLLRSHRPKLSERFSTGYFSPSQVCCDCFVVSYYNADFSVVKSLFPSFFARVSHSADFPVCFSRGGQFFVHLSKSTPERSRKYFRPLKQFCRVKKFVRGAYRTPNGFLTTGTAARPHRPPPAHTPSAAPSSTPVCRPPPRRQCRSPAVRHRP